MKQKIKLFSFLILFSFFVGSSINSITNAHTFQSNNYSDLIDKQVRNIQWDNGMDYSTAIWSQWDQEYPIEACAADDFSFKNDTYINGVSWIGFYAYKSKCQDSPQFDMQITFFLDRGDGNAPGTVVTGPIFFYNSQVNETYLEPNWHSYNVTLPETILFVKNQVYWICIQAVAPVGPQWFLGVHLGTIILHEVVWKCDFFHVYDWEDAYESQGYHENMCFQLFGYESYIAPVINGPFEGISNVEYTFYTDPITGSSGDTLYCRWDWDDGNITDWLGPYASGSIVFASHAWEVAGVYDIRAQLKGAGGESNWSEPHTITIVQNQPPSTPIITGPSQGKRGINYNYEIESIDPENENVSYYIDWGDETNTGWIGPHPSGQEQTLNHTWNKKGTYTIKAKAKDSHDQESDWGTLSITMPYEPPHFRIFEWLFERFPHAFPLLQYLLQKIE